MGKSPEVAWVVDVSHQADLLWGLFSGSPVFSNTVDSFKL